MNLPSDDNPPEQTKLRVAQNANTFNIVLTVKPGLDNRLVKLTDDSGLLEIYIPVSLFPWLELGDRPVVFISLVKTSIEFDHPTPSSIILGGRG